MTLKQWGKWLIMVTGTLALVAAVVVTAWVLKTVTDGWSDAAILVGIVGWVGYTRYREIVEENPE